MQLYSSDYSILINKTNGCDFDLKVNPAILTSTGQTPIGSINFAETSTISYNGNGVTVPAQFYVKISGQSGNALSVKNDGLFVSISNSYSDQQARASISANSPLSYNSTTGVMSISFANTSSPGALSANDWNIFNSKLTALENIGSGFDVFRQTVGNIAQIKRLAQGTNISIVDSGNTLTINATGNSSYTDQNARAAISGVAPILYNSATGVISISQSGASTNGSLSSTDWNNFNNKVPQSRVINTTLPLVGGGNLSSDLTLAILTANSTTDGILTSTDWNTFNNKQSPITWQNVTAGSSKISLGGTPTGAVKNAFSVDVVENQLNRANFTGVTPISGGGTGQTTAMAAILALLPSVTGNGTKVLGTDGSVVSWVVGGGGSGGENPLTFIGPLSRVGDSISIPVANSTTDGYLSASNYNNFAGRVNDGNNLGTIGARVFAQKTGTNLDFRRILAGTNVTIVENTSDITIGFIPGSITGGNALLSTAAELAANTTAQTALPYYIYDNGQEGYFFYDSTDTVSTSNGTTNGGTQNAGTIIRSANGRVYKRRDYIALDIRWFGGKANGAVSGTTFTGTDNTIPLNSMLAVAGISQPCIVPYGTWYFATKPAAWTAKTVKLEIQGNTLHGASFINVTNNIDTGHVFLHKGSALRRVGLPSDDYDTWLAGNGPAFDTFTDFFIEVNNCYHMRFEMTFVEGWKAAIALGSGPDSGGAFSGGQECYFRFDYLRRNTYGIYFYSTNGNSFCDKNQFFGGRIGGKWGIYFEGDTNDATTANKQGAFTSNKFYNVLVERCINGIGGVGAIRENNFIGFDIEGGQKTGVFSTNKFNITNTADPANGGTQGNNKFTNFEYFYDTWFNTGSVGKDMIMAATPIVSGTAEQAGVTLGTFALGGRSTGRTTIIGSANLTQAKKNELPASWDYISFLTTGHSTDPVAKPQQFAFVKVDGIEQTVTYEGKFIDITAASTTTSSYTAIPPTGYIRVAPSDNGAITIVMDRSQVQNGKWFWIEMASTGTVRIIRSDDSSVALPTTAITSTGYYFVRFHTTGFAFVATKLGGASTTYAFGAIGAGTANGGSISGSTITLHGATSTTPGLVTTGTQSFAGAKTFLNTVILTAQSGTGTRMLTVAADGTIGNQAIPGGGSSTYIFSTGLSESSGTVTNNLSTGIAASNQNIYGSVNASGNLTLNSTTSGTKGKIIVADQLWVRKNSGSSLSAPIVFDTSATVIQTVAQPGALQAIATDLYWTNAAGLSSQLITSDNTAVLKAKDWQSNIIRIAYGGTEASTAQGARTNLLPSQASNAGKILYSDGSDVYWDWIGGDDYEKTYTLDVTQTTNFVTIASFPIDIGEVSLWEVRAVAVSENFDRYSTAFSFTVNKTTNSAANITNIVTSYPENFSVSFDCAVSPSIYTVSGIANMQIGVAGVSTSHEITWKLLVKRIKVIGGAAP